MKRKTKTTEGFLVKLKSVKELREFGRHLGGDFSESLSYFINMCTGKLIPRNEEPNAIDGAFSCFTKHVLENGEEFLVIDHPNIITKREYDMSKELYHSVMEIPHSAKGVY